MEWPAWLRQPPSQPQRYRIAVPHKTALPGGTGHLNATEDRLPIDEEAVTGGAGQQVTGGGTHPDKLSVYVKNATCRIGSRPCGIRVSLLA